MVGRCKPVEVRFKRTSSTRAFQILSDQLRVPLGHQLTPRKKQKTYKRVAFLPEKIGGNWSHWIDLTTSSSNLVDSCPNSAWFSIHAMVELDESILNLVCSCPTSVSVLSYGLF
eukprot:6317878-Ditylum_brightwellii.AAC.1